jgi:hypothetical protein
MVEGGKNIGKIELKNEKSQPFTTQTVKESLE